MAIQQKISPHLWFDGERRRQRRGHEEHRLGVKK